MSSLFDNISSNHRSWKDCKDAIKSKGINVADNTPVSEFGNKIREISGLTYSIDYNVEDKSVTDVSLKFSEPIEVVIPSEIDGVQIKTIETGQYSNINKIVIPTTIETIKGGTADDNNGAFRNNKDLVRADFGGFVGRIKIEDYAFAGCSNLTDTNIINSYAVLGNHAFDGCDLSNVQIYRPDQSDIGHYVFANTNLKGTAYFRGSSASSVFAHSTGMFYNCTKLEQLEVDRLYLSDKQLWWVADYYFYNCVSLSSIGFQNYMHRAGAYSFYNCKLLVIPIVLKGNVSQYSFAYSGITSIYYGWYYYEGGTLSRGAFLNCKNLEYISIGNMINAYRSLFQSGAVGGCTSLKFISIPQLSDSIFNQYGGEVEFIGLTAGELDGVQYDGCTSLTDIYYGGNESDALWQSFIAVNTIPSGVTVHFGETRRSL